MPNTVERYPKLHEFATRRLASTPTLPYYATLWPPVGTPLKGVIFELHGGGWLDSPDLTNAALQYVAPWAAHGWLIYSTSYTPNGGSIASVSSTYDALKANSGSLPIVTMGQSAGGHLALMLAGFKQLDAVIVEGAPTQLDANFTPFIENFVETAWKGVERQMSPAYLTGMFTASSKILLGTATGDPFIPNSQAHVFEVNHPGGGVLDLTTEYDQTKWTPYTDFTHSYVTKASMDAWKIAQGIILG